MDRKFRGWHLRSLLVAVAVLASLLGWIRFEITRPYPTGCVTDGASPPVVIWSDHKSHDRDRGPKIHPVFVQNGRVMSRLRWSDGVTTTYLHWPNR